VYFFVFIIRIVLFHERDLKGQIVLPTFFCSAGKQQILGSFKANIPGESSRKVSVSLRKIKVSSKTGLPFHHFQCMLHPLIQNLNETYVCVSG
jgi:hypothetical protein